MRLDLSACEWPAVCYHGRKTYDELTTSLMNASASCGDQVLEMKLLFLSAEEVNAKLLEVAV